MSNETYITVRGRLTGDVDLRFTPNGAAVANFTVASNARQFDKQTNEWKDKQATFWRCSAWRETGENAAEHLAKGDAVILLAEVESRSYTTKENENRTVTELKVEAIGKDLRWAKPKNGGPSQGAQNVAAGLGGQQQGGWSPKAQNDAWGAPSGGGGWGGSAPDSNEPPF